MNSIPDYRDFLTVDELKASSRALADRYPDVVKLLEIGASRQGEKIECLKIGSGSQAALLFGCPHPNEPIGAMTLEHLSERLASDEAFRSAFDYTWYIIKCVDPDGTRLNEGWFKGPFTVENYARNFFRPAGYQQVEWTFPVDYKTLKFDRPLPETRALMGLIESVRPSFVYSLHNAGFGGVFYYLSRPLPGAYAELHAAAAEAAIPLSLGEAEMPWCTRYDQAIYELPTVAANYDYLEQYGQGDPARLVHGGASSAEYAARFGDSLTLVTEVPYFYDVRIADTTPGQMTRREASLRSLELRGELLGFIASALNDLEQAFPASLAGPAQTALLTPGDDPFYLASRETANRYAAMAAAQRRWAENDPGLAETATVAQQFDSLQVSVFYALLNLGVFRRLVLKELDLAERLAADPEQAETARRWSDRVRELAQAVEEKFTTAARNLEAELNYRSLPVRQLIQAQLKAGIVVMRGLQR